MERKIVLLHQQIVDSKQQTKNYFYDFPEIHDAKEWKTTYRSILDTLDLDQSQKNAIFAEANYAFRLNMYMFDEIKSEDPYPAMTALHGFWKVITGSITNK